MDGDDSFFEYSNNGLKLLCTQDVKGRAKATPQVDQKCDELPNRGIEPTTASIGGRFELGEPVLAIRACSAIPTGYLQN